MAIATISTKKKKQEDILFEEFNWIENNLCKEINDATNIFFEKNINFRLVGLSNGENLLFYGDEYFVNNIQITPTTNFKIKLSGNVVGFLLDVSLGVESNRFDLQSLTDIEANLIKSFTTFLYKRLEEKFTKTEPDTKAIRNSKEYSITIFVQDKGLHKGKIIINIPDYILGEIPKIEKKENYSIGDFKSTFALVKVGVGTSKITLKDIRHLEEGDVIVLENSNINTMEVNWEGQPIKFRINPNPELILGINNDGGNEMAEEINTPPHSMWDSILVDIVAEFDNVKLTLGELKQISEGLVIDVGSVYDNKIKLRVENQVVASGELVIINDRYGVRIDEVAKSISEVTHKPDTEAKKVATKPNAQEKPAMKNKKEATTSVKEEDSENFDYSDFEIEDESI